MARLEDITVGSNVKGIVAGDTVSIVAVQWFGTNVIEITYKNSVGVLGTQMLFRETKHLPKTHWLCVKNLNWYLHKFQIMERNNDHSGY